MKIIIKVRKGESFLLFSIGLDGSLEFLTIKTVTNLIPRSFYSEILLLVTAKMINDTVVCSCSISKFPTDYPWRCRLVCIPTGTEFPDAGCVL